MGEGERERMRSERNNSKVIIKETSGGPNFKKGLDSKIKQGILQVISFQKCCRLFCLVFGIKEQ